MVSKTSFDFAGRLPERSQLYNVAFPASGVSATGSGIWTFASIKRGLEKRCRDVKEIRVDEANRRLIAATDRESGLRFVALMTHANGQKDMIESMLYACSFTGYEMTEERANIIDGHLAVTLAYEADGDLFLVASPNIVGAFDVDFFDGQLQLFLQDIRTARRLLLDDGAQRAATTAALRSLMAAGDPELGALQNSVSASRFQIGREVSMFGPRHDCATCGGKGRRLFRACTDCNGVGFTR